MRSKYQASSALITDVIEEHMDKVKMVVAHVAAMDLRGERKGSAN
jgi:hypothetical protein